MPYSRNAFGVLPPISALSPEQAAYYFLSGYTAKLAGTEAYMETDVEATTKDCTHCMSSIPVAASVCAFCTRDVAAA